MRDVPSWLPNGNSDRQNLWFPHKKLMEELEHKREMKELEQKITENVLAQINRKHKIEVDNAAKKEIEELRKTIKDLMNFGN